MCRVLDSGELPDPRREYAGLLYMAMPRIEGPALEALLKDAGPLRVARYTEPFALLVAQLAYEGEGGPELAYRFERFGRKG